MNTPRQKFDEYYESAKQHCKRWEVDDPHVINVCQSVMMTRDNFLQGGSFVQAVNDNNLRLAVISCDNTCLKHLKVIVLAKTQAYVEDISLTTH